MTDRHAVANTGVKRLAQNALVTHAWFGGPELKLLALGSHPACRIIPGSPRSVPAGTPLRQSTTGRAGL